MWILLLSMGIALAGCDDDSTQPDGSGDVTLAVEVVATGLDAPVFMTAPLADGRFFVVAKATNSPPWLAIVPPAICEYSP